MSFDERHWGARESARLRGDDDIRISCCKNLHTHNRPMEPNTVSESLAFSRADKLVIAACAISMLIVQMDWFALNLALPAIGRRFNVPTTDLQWVVSGYMLSIGALMVTAGRLADIFGHRRVIVIGLAIFGIVSIVCGSAPDEWFLIVARVVHGIGAALIFPVSIAVVSSTFSGARQARAIGVVLGVSAIGQALGPFVGGTFAEYLNWRGVFFINVPFCIAAIYLMLRYVKESRDEKADRHIDVPGMLAITGGLVCISLAFDRGEAWGWTSLLTVGTLGAGIALLVLFVAIEKRVKSPLVSLDLFRNRAFDAVVIAGSLSNVVFCFVAVFSALYLQGARGMSPFESGLVFLALSAGAGSASYFSGRLAEKFPADRLMAIGMLISAAGIVALTSVTSLWLYTALFLVTGVGLGLGWALSSVATQAVVPPEYVGQRLLMLVSMWLDDAEDPAGAELIGRLTETGEPCIKATTVLPFAAGVQRLIDVEFEDGHRYYTKEAHVADLADDAIDKLDAFWRHDMPMEGEVEIIGLGGAIGDVAEADSAFSNRGYLLWLNFAMRWDDPADDDDYIARTRNAVAGLAPWIGRGVYVNMLNFDEQDRVVEALGGTEKYAALARLKARYDPANLFRMNANITPA